MSSHYNLYNKRCDVSQMLGKTLLQVKGLDDSSDEATFICSDGSEFLMYHSQDCCESVGISDVEGDVEDLIGLPLVVCEEVDSSDFPPPPGEYVESYTWTFYRLATTKGFVVVRWLGESNGYYGESVDFSQVKP